MIPHQTVDGGENRFESVKNGLSVVGEPGWIAVHDGVRPFVSAGVIEACFREAKKHGAVIPVMPVVDSIRERNEQGETLPLDRSRYVTIQTPQVFNSNILIESYFQPYRPEFTDDASVVEVMGYKIHTTQGNRENIKITGPFDLFIAEALLSKHAGRL
jgi:2-C-methyl-D-erythritol 4-phosphate cytidylyltransferase